MYKPIGLFIGRFQPFHRGHLLVIQGMVKMCKKVVIVIGSSQEKKTEKNPYSALERKEMIQRALQAENIIPVHDIILTTVPDVESDTEWVLNVLETSGEVGKLWTGNQAVIKCFEGQEIDVQEIKEVPGISDGEIRKLMCEGGKWEKLVPLEVKKYIGEIKGVERVKNM
jgi:nicotinamide-nucleotide adenylyltransferase